MKKFIENIIIIIARIILIGIYTALYVVPLHILLYMLIFADENVITEVSFKCFLVAYFTSFIILYRKVVKDDKEQVNEQNQAFQSEIIIKFINSSLYQLLKEIIDVIRVIIKINNYLYALLVRKYTDGKSYLKR